MTQNSEHYRIMNLFDAFLAMAGLVSGLWLIHVIDAVFFKRRLKRRCGLIPRARFDPLRLFFSFCLHSDYRHLAANSLPLLVLGTLVLAQEGVGGFGLVLFIIIIVKGVAIWLFGRPDTLHLGASGVILGCYGYTLGHAVVSPDIMTLLAATVVMIFYLGLWRQVLTLRREISTLGHLFGFVGGLTAVVVMAGISPAG